MQDLLILKPAVNTCPKITSLTSSAGTELRPGASLIAIVPSSLAGTHAKPPMKTPMKTPMKAPIGVRAAPVITTSFIVQYSVNPD
jgi:hypothetical protein